MYKRLGAVGPPDPQSRTAAPTGIGNGGNKFAEASTDPSYHPAADPSRPSTIRELRQLAAAARRIPSPFRASPETILLAKDDIASRLARLADAMECAP